jgi:hypothetical protein
MLLCNYNYFDHFTNYFDIYMFKVSSFSKKLHRFKNMTEAEVGKDTNGTSSNVTTVKCAQVIDPKDGNREAGDSDNAKQDDKSDTAKPKDNGIAVTDVKCDIPKPDKGEDAQKDGENTIDQNQKSDENQRRGRYHDRNRTVIFTSFAQDQGCYGLGPRFFMALKRVGL